MQKAYKDAAAPCYFRLCGEHFDYYVNELRADLGRSVPPNPTAPFLFIGDSKQISRHHATIFWDKEGRMWKLHVLGRNTVVVNGEAFKLGINSEPPYLPLSSSKAVPIRIGDIKMWFSPVDAAKTVS